MESKQEHLVFAADPEIQLGLLLCKKTLGVKARVYKIGKEGFLKKHQGHFRICFCNLTKSVKKTRFKTEVLQTAAN